MTSSSHPDSKILVVDDEVETCEVLQGFLHGEGFRVEAAHDGDEALTQLEKFNPACILLDINMPRMNGLDALNLIKFRRPDVEVIMVTALAGVDKVKESIKKGAFGYISKPVDLEILLRDINAALDHRVENLQQLEVSKKRRERQVDHLLEETRHLQSQTRKLDEDLYSALKFNLTLMDFILPEFGRHSRQVARWSRDLAGRLGLLQPRMCELAGWYHDTGKLCLPARLLEKEPDRLAPHERMVFHNFPLYGQELVQTHLRRFDLGVILRHQCERVDGDGFPDRLPGSRIPLESKILAVANAFVENMERIAIENRDPGFLLCAQALEAVGQGADTRFDPAVLEALGQVVQTSLETEPETVEVSLAELEPKMVLAEDAVTQNGHLVLPKNTVLIPLHIQKIQDIHAIEPLASRLLVFATGK